MDPGCSRSVRMKVDSFCMLGCQCVLFFPYIGIDDNEFGLVKV